MLPLSPLRRRKRPAPTPLLDEQTVRNRPTRFVLDDEYTSTKYKQKIINQIARRELERRDKLQKEHEARIREMCGVAEEEYSTDSDFEEQEPTCKELSKSNAKAEEDQAQHKAEQVLQDTSSRGSRGRTAKLTISKQRKRPSRRQYQPLFDGAVRRRKPPQDTNQTKARLSLQAELHADHQQVEAATRSRAIVREVDRIRKLQAVKRERRGEAPLQKWRCEHCFFLENRIEDTFCVNCRGRQPKHLAKGAHNRAKRNVRLDLRLANCTDEKDRRRSSKRKDPLLESLEDLPLTADLVPTPIHVQRVPPRFYPVGESARCADCGASLTSNNVRYRLSHAPNSRHKSVQKKVCKECLAGSEAVMSVDMEIDLQYAKDLGHLDGMKDPTPVELQRYHKSLLKNEKLLKEDTPSLVGVCWKCLHPSPRNEERKWITHEGMRHQLCSWCADSKKKTRRRWRGGAMSTVTCISAE